MILFFTVLILFALTMLMLMRAMKRQLAHHAKGSGLAHCQCGMQLSEWFAVDGYMWCPPYVGGCGRVSKYTTHEEYRNAEVTR